MIKVNRDYTPGLRRLQTQMTPGRISATVKVMSRAQENVILHMGFGSLLKVNMDGLPGLPHYYLLDNYDLQIRRLVLYNVVVHITKDTVHDIRVCQLKGIT